MLLNPAKRSLREAVVKEELLIVVAFGQPHSAVCVGAPGLESSQYIGRVVRASVAKQDKSVILTANPLVNSTFLVTPESSVLSFAKRK